MFKSRRKPYAEVDERIKPLVDCMNATGLFRTVASCEGHGRPLRPPYVYFKADVPDAAGLDGLVRHAAWRSLLRQHWMIEGRFNHEHELTFILYSPALHSMSSHQFGCLRIGLFRGAIDADIGVLADLVRQYAATLQTQRALTMYFSSQAEYEAYYSPEAKAAREATIRAESEATITRALQFYNAGDKDAAAACLFEAGFDVDSWFAIWR